MPRKGWAQLGRRVIFLDIDGVLNCRTTHERFAHDTGIERRLADRFLGLLERVRAEVVLSSTWRFSTKHRAHIEEHFPIADITPQIGSRGVDIQAWLDANEVGQYAIIDDNRDMLPEQHAFHTDWEIGLTDEIVEAVIAHFERGPRGG